MEFNIWQKLVIAIAILIVLVICVFPPATYFPGIDASGNSAVLITPHMPKVTLFLLTNIIVCFGLVLILKSKRK